MISVLRRARFRRLCDTPFYYELLKCCSTSSANVKIQIPKRIERSPTDILEALAKTVQRDPTAAHYKFPDDPFFATDSQGLKRSYALSKEAGRKAAWWVVNQHKNLFQHKVADPPIETFFPAKEYTKENSDLNVLSDLMNKTEVTNAITVYKILKEQNIYIDNSVKLKLLELCCFYNSEDHGDERLVEEKWFFRNDEEGPSMKTWKSNGFAEELFLELENNPQAVCAMIQGRIKFCDVNAGYDLYSEASSNGIPLNTGVYNSLISVVDSLKQNDDDRWKLVLNFLREMNEKRIAVNLGTLNAALKSLARMSRLINTEDSLLPLLTEFKRLNIEPSLGSYYYILKHFYHRQRKLPKGLLNTIVAKICGKELEIRHESDVYFFPLAMNLCNAMRDLPTAEKLNETLNIRGNHKFLSNDMHETRYFRDYIRLVFLEESIERAMEIYQTLVPMMYAPDFSTLESVIDAINKNGAVEYFPIMWKQLAADIRSEKVYEAFLNAIISNPEADVDRSQFYSEVADKIYFAVEPRMYQERSLIRWTPSLMTGVLTLYVRAKDIKNARVVLQTAQKRSNMEIRSGALNEFLDLCISLNQPALAIECLQYAEERSFLSSSAMAKKIRSEFLLDDKQNKYVSSVIDESK